MRRIDINNSNNLSLNMTYWKTALSYQRELLAKENTALAHATST